MTRSFNCTLGNLKFPAVVLVACALTCSGCTTNNAPISKSMIPIGATDWVIMDPPQRSPRITFPDPTTGKDVTKAWAQLSNKDILKLLSNTRSEISIGKKNAEGKFTYLAANATGEKGTYLVTMDYMPYIVEDAIDETTKEKIGSARIGVGLRLSALVTTSKSNIDLGSLLALGVAASLNQLKGTMTADTIGIRLDGSAGPILSNATIDETSILKSLEALAVIQSKMSDSTTHLDPQVMWVKPYAEKYKPSDVLLPLR